MYKIIIHYVLLFYIACKGKYTACITILFYGNSYWRENPSTGKRATHWTHGVIANGQYIKIKYLLALQEKTYRRGDADETFARSQI